MKHDNDNQRPAIVANSEPLRFLSVCSGIEAASVAWPQWHAVAFAEIEKFPSAVLAHHYPDVPNLGDFTRINTTTLGRVDILCGGTPCQAFSVAGKREGLADARGNLTLSFVELAHELAGYGKTDGNELRNVVWENVVGVLSDKTNAFGCFLAGLVGADAAIVPPGRWTNAGMVAGPKGRAAWRVFDAQYFGVAQRRRRVIVVADFGNGADPAAVLLVEEGLRRDTPQSREKGKSVAGAAKGGAGVGGGLGNDFDLDGGLVRTFDRQSNAEYGEAGVASTVSARDYKSPTDLVVGVTGDVAHTLKAEGADASEDGTGRGTPIIALGAQNSSRQGDSVSTEVTPTLDKSKIPAVTVAIRGREGGATADLGGEVATALRASQGGGDKPHVLAGVVHAFDARQSDVLQYGDITGPMDTGVPGPAALVNSAVRRLTPVECERLMGFPDNYTAIPWRGKPADQCPDGPRYKALGNSWAVPLFAWLGKRIDMHMPRTAANDNKESARAA